MSRRRPSEIGKIATSSDDFMRDVPIGRIELWHKTHYNLEKGWSTPECRLLYEKLITLQSQSTKEDSTPLTDDEICKRVLGTRPGYLRGLGHGVGPLHPHQQAFTIITRNGR